MSNPPANFIDLTLDDEIETRATTIGSPGTSPPATTLTDLTPVVLRRTGPTSTVPRIAVAAAPWTPEIPIAGQNNDVVQTGLSRPTTTYDAVSALQAKAAELRSKLDDARLLLSFRYGDNLDNINIGIPTSVMDEYITFATPFLTNIQNRHEKDMRDVFELGKSEQKIREYKVETEYEDEMGDMMKEIRNFLRKVCQPAEVPEVYLRKWKAVDEELSNVHKKIMGMTGTGML